MPWAERSPRCCPARITAIARWVKQPTGIEPPVEGAGPLLHVFPNPTTTGASLSFTSAVSSPMALEVYDLAGRLVGGEDLGVLTPGSHSLFWDGCGGSSLAPGVYFLRLHGGGFQAVAEVVLTR